MTHMWSIYGNETPTVDGSILKPLDAEARMGMGNSHSVEQWMVGVAVPGIEKTLEKHTEVSPASRTFSITKGVQATCPSN